MMQRTNPVLHHVFIWSEESAKHKGAKLSWQLRLLDGWRRKNCLYTRLCTRTHTIIASNSSYVQVICTSSLCLKMDEHYEKNIVKNYTPHWDLFIDYKRSFLSHNSVTIHKHFTLRCHLSRLCQSNQWGTSEKENCVMKLSETFLLHKTLYIYTIFWN